MSEFAQNNDEVADVTQANIEAGFSACPEGNLMPMTAGYFNASFQWLCDLIDGLSAKLTLMMMQISGILGDILNLQNLASDHGQRISALELCVAELKNPTNATPLADGTPPPDQTINDGDAISPMDFSGCFSDPDGDPLTYAIVPPVAGLSVSAAGVVSGTPTGMGTLPATVTVNVRATDPDGAFADCSASLTVNSQTDGTSQTQFVYDDCFGQTTLALLVETTTNGVTTYMLDTPSTSSPIRFISTCGGDDTVSGGVVSQLIYNQLVLHTQCAAGFTAEEQGC